MAEGSFANTSDYVRALIRDDRAKRAQAMLEAKLIEGLALWAGCRSNDAYWEGLKREVNGPDRQARAQAFAVTRRRILRRPAADRDVRQAALLIAGNNPKAAIGFVDAVRATEQLLLDAPAWAPPATTATAGWPACAGIS